MEDDLAPGLWTPEEQVLVWTRLLQWCADHPDEATPRLIAMYRDRLAKAEQRAKDEREERMAKARRREVAGQFVEQMLSDLNLVNAALYGGKGGA